jgi:hypothetical protein
MMTVLIHAWLLAFTTLAVDLGGRPITQLAPPGTRALVLFFAASDCPISNRYVPEIQRLTRQFEPLGVRVWFVYPNPSDDAKTVRAHDAEFAIDANTALDTSQRLVQMAHVTVTPEAAVFVPQGKQLREVYRGRIDDSAPSGRKPSVTTSKKRSAPCLRVSRFRSPEVHPRAAR